MVCKGFNGIESSLIKSLEELLNQINVNKSNKMFLANILPNYMPSNEFKYTTNVSSIILSNSISGKIICSLTPNV